MPLLTILFFCSWTFNLAAIVFVVIFPSAAHTAETEVAFLQAQPGLYSWSFRSSCPYVLYLAVIVYFWDHDRTGFSGPAEELPCILKHVPSQEGSLLSHRTKQEENEVFLTSLKLHWIQTEIWPSDGDSVTYGRRQGCSSQGGNDVVDSSLGLPAWTETSIEISALPDAILVKPFTPLIFWL